MATAKLGEYPVFRAYDTTTKLPLSGGKLYTYENGTTTDKAVYTDETKTTAATNPVILDSNGESTFYMDGEYTFKLDSSADVNLWTVDGINKQTTSASVAYDSNLIENPSFELDSDSDGSPDNWTKTTWGTVAFDTTDPYHGDQSLKFTSVGSGGGQIISTNFIDVSVANNYILRFSLKSSVADIRNVVEVLWYDKDQAAISTTSAYDDSATNPTSWTEKIFTVTPGALAMFAKVRITGAHNSDSTPGNVLFDHISLQEHRALDLETATSQAVTSALTVGAPTGGSKGAGTINVASGIYDNNVQLSPPTDVTNYTEAQNITIDDDVGYNLTAFDIDSSVTTATWESVGPTGSTVTSGASTHNIWTPLDDVPSGAKFVILSTRLVLSGATNASEYNARIWIRVGGSSTDPTGQGPHAESNFYNRSGSQESDTSVTNIYVPIDSSARFDVYWNTSGTSATAGLSFYLVGWGE